MREHSDTRQRIQAIALDLFTEQGYEATSLREIAEQLGVTKAALYYHFRTKEDIVGSAMSGYADRFEELASWARTEPPGRARDEHLVDRLLALVQSDGGIILRFGQTNPAVVERSEFGGMQLGVLRTLVSAIAGDDPTPEASLRATLLFAALMLGAVGGESPLPIGGDQATRTAAARAVALDLLAPLGAP